MTGAVEKVALRPSPFFSSFTVECVSWYWVVGRIEKKNKKSRNRTTLKVNIHIFGFTKCTIYYEKCSCFCSCFSLCCYYAHFSDLRIISSEKWFIYVVTFYFFLENAKNLVGRTTVNGEKKRGWPKRSEMALSWTTTFSQLSSKGLRREPRASLGSTQAQFTKFTTDTHEVLYHFILILG